MQLVGGYFSLWASQCMSLGHELLSGARILSVPFGNAPWCLLRISRPKDETIVGGNIAIAVTSLSVPNCCASSTTVNARLRCHSSNFDQWEVRSLVCVPPVMTRRSHSGILFCRTVCGRSLLVDCPGLFASPSEISLPTRLNTSAGNFK